MLASCVMGGHGLLTVQDLQGDLEGSDSMCTAFYSPPLSAMVSFILTPSFQTLQGSEGELAHFLH